MSGRIISAASVVMTLPLRVHRLPDRGGAATATMVTTSVGGAFIVMNAAASQGAEVINTCPLGTGPNSALVRRAMNRTHIETVSATVVGDTGMKLALLESDGQTTSIVSPGVESEIQPSVLESLETRSGDLVYISAGDLLYPAYHQALTSWLPTLPSGVRVAFAASPLIDQVPTEWIREILPYCRMVTMNMREGAILSERFQIAPGQLRAAIAQELPEDCIIVRRSGEAGCTVKVGVNDEVHQFPSYHTATGDTIGVGETHIGVMIAHLALGTDPFIAAELANAASAVAVAMPGVPWTPGPEVLRDITAGRSSVTAALRQAL